MCLTSLLALLAVGIAIGGLRTEPARTGAAQGAAGTSAADASLRTIFNPPRRVSAGVSRAAGAARTGAPTIQRAAASGTYRRLIVKFEDKTPPKLARKILAGVDARLQLSVWPLGMQVVQVPAGDIDAVAAKIAESSHVAYVEHDAEVKSFTTTPNDILWREQWGPKVVDAPNAWDSAIGSAKIVIAVLDTGIDATHPDLRDAVLPGYDFANADADAQDDNGHGTSAAGVIAARTNNGKGQAGICWRCSLMPIKVLDEKRAGTTSAVAAGIVWAVDHGAHVISMSLGGTEPTRTLAEAVAYALERGVMVVAAAGNDGTADMAYPAAYVGVVGVAATRPDDSLYEWSNFGSWVEVAAPGCNIAPDLDHDYVNFCGTSAAAPVVAGIAGLALSARPEASRTQVETAIFTSARPVGTAVHHGRVNAELTLEALGIGPPQRVPTPVFTPAPTSVGARAPTPPTTVRGTVRIGLSARYDAHLARPGRVTATLTTRTRLVVRLAVINDRGATIARVSGPSPLRLSRTVGVGDYRLVVSAPQRVGFTLRFQAGDR